MQYSASKAALHALSRVLEMEVKGFGVQVMLQVGFRTMYTVGWLMRAASVLRLEESDLDLGASSSIATGRRTTVGLVLSTIPTAETLSHSHIWIRERGYPRARECRTRRVDGPAHKTCS